MPWQERDELNLREAFELARAGMQSLLIVNGGAAAGLLAFDGDVITHVGRALLDQHRLLCAVEVFLFGGVGGAVGAMIAAYILQLRYGSTRLYDNPSDDQKSSGRIHVIAAILALLSLISFLVGVWTAGSAFPKA